MSRSLHHGCSCQLCKPWKYCGNSKAKLSASDRRKLDSAKSQETK